jgi:hypothetical protein
MRRHIARWTGLDRFIRDAVRRGIVDAVKPLRGDITRLQRRVDELHARLEQVSEQLVSAERAVRLLKHVVRLNAAHRDELERLDVVLDEARIAAHVRTAIAAAPLETDPYPHIVVDKVLPADVYKLLLKAIPPPAFFGERDPIKQNLRIPFNFGPALATRALGFLEEAISRRAIQPAVVEKFRELLQQHYDRIFGPEFRQRANELPQSVSGGRVMLRRPGYHLAPHRDPKRSMLTCLLYFARSGDSETYGTQIFRVRHDREAAFAHTYYPEEDGRTCELVKMVPYRPNTMLVFLNSSGAHGATIPADAPASLERYAYQFYVGPEGDALQALIGDLPPDRREMWRNKKDALISERES